MKHKTHSPGRLAVALTGSLKRLARRFGYDIRRYSVTSSESLRFAVLLANKRVDVVFDVGANVGQFGESLRDAGYRGKIVSFEPLSAARSQLLVRSERDPDWVVAEQAAIGESDGEVEIHIAGNSVSSSVLGMLEAHSAVAPDSRYVGSERVKVRPLDSIGVAHLAKDASLFLKVDTQGYEMQVIRGARAILQRAIGCQLELSLVPLYEGQIGYLDLIAEMSANGMDLWDLAPVLVDPDSGRLLQVDATFVRRG
jgi:FkbM family methyltransferase